MAEKEDRPEWDSGVPENSESSLAGRWIDAPVENSPSVTEEPAVATPTEVLPPEPTPPQEFNSSTQVTPAPSKRRSLRALILIVIALILVAAVGFFGLTAYNSAQDRHTEEKVHQQVQQQKKEKAKAIKEAVNPFSVLIGKVAEPSTAPLAVAVAKNRLTVGDSSLSIAGGTLSPTVNSCSLGPITDICLGARGKLGTGGFDVLVVKDISRTRILDNPSEFKEIQGSLGVSAASMAIDMGDTKGPDRFGALTANGTTGFVLIFPQGTTAARVEEVLKASTVI